MNHFDETEIIFESAAGADDRIPDAAAEGTAESEAVKQEILRILSRYRSQASETNSEGKDDEEDECEDADDSDKEDDESAEDDEDDDDDWDIADDEDEEMEIGTVTDAVPGKRVILRSNYKSNNAYCNAVIHSMQEILQKDDVSAEPREIQHGVKVFSFDKSTHGVDIDCHILVEYEICNYRIEFIFNVKNRHGRVPLIDYFCQQKNFTLRYGSLIMDHNDGEKKMEYSSCFYGAFSEEAFLRYWGALCATLRAYAEDYENISCGKKLSPDMRKIARMMVGELACNLPAKVKPENEATFNCFCEMFGDDLSEKNKKLLNYLIEQNA